MKRPKFHPGQDYYWFCEKFLHYITDSQCAQIDYLPPGTLPRGRCSWRRFRKFYKRLCDNKNYKYHDWYGYEKLDYSKQEHLKPLCKWRVREMMDFQGLANRLDKVAPNIGLSYSDRRKMVNTFLCLAYGKPVLDIIAFEDWMETNHPDYHDRSISQFLNDKDPDNIQEWKDLLGVFQDQDEDCYAKEFPDDEQCDTEN